MKIVNESLILNPKSEEDILEDLTNEISFECSNIAISLGYNRYSENNYKLKLSYGTGEDFFNFKYNKIKIEGTYFSFPDNSVEDAQNIISEVTSNYNKIGNSTFVIYDETLVIEKKVIRKLCQKIINKELDWFHIRNF